MKRPDIEAIEARADAATAGPWGVIKWTDDPPEAFVSPGPPMGYDHEMSRADATFIAASRTDVPALIAWTRHLEGLLREAGESIAFDYGDDEESVLRIGEALGTKIRGVTQE